MMKSNNFLWLFFIFIFIYAPNIVGLPIPSPVLLLPFTYYFLNKKDGAVSRLISIFKYEYLILIILLLYIMVHDFTYGSNYYFSHVIYYIVDVFPTSFVIVIFFLCNYERENFYKLLIKIGTIAAFISFVSFIVPAIHNILLFALKQNIIVSDDIGRNYGFASGFLYAYPLAQGVIGVMCLKMLNNNKKYLVNFILILISIIINARIGLVPIVIYFLYLFFTSNIKSIFYVSIISMLFILIYTNGLLNKYSDLIEWNLTMFYDVSNYFFGTTYGEYGGTYTWFDFVKDNFIILPSTTITWIFGENRDVFLDPINNSDMGYINDLIYGGLILVALITIFFTKISMRFAKIKNADARLFSLVILFVYLIANLKGEFFRPSPCNRILLLVYVFFIYKNHLQKINKI